MNQHILPKPADIEAALGLGRKARARRWLRRIVTLAILAVIIAAAYYAYDTRQQAASAYNYETVSPETRDIIVTVSATGTVQPLTSVDVATEMTGVVREVLVRENDVVKTGDVLARLDTERLNAQRGRVLAQLESARAQVDSARASLEDVKADLVRQLALHKRDFASADKLESAQVAVTKAEATLAVEEADVRLYEADLKVIDTDLARGTVVSPINGVVLFRKAEPGQTVVSTSSVSTLFTIAEDLTGIQVKVNVDEADIGQVKEGQEATFSVDAYRGESFPAKIDRLSFASDKTDGVVTYAAVLSASNQELRLRPGMTATARIVVDRFDQTLTIANSAFRFQPPREDSKSRSLSISSLFLPRMPPPDRGRRTIGPDGLRSIYVLVDGKPVERRVKTGATDGRFTVITGTNLTPEDQVVISARAASN